MSWNILGSLEGNWLLCLAVSVNLLRVCWFPLFLYIFISYAHHGTVPVGTASQLQVFLRYTDLHSGTWPGAFPSPRHRSRSTVEERRWATQLHKKKRKVSSLLSQVNQIQQKSRSDDTKNWERHYDLGSRLKYSVRTFVNLSINCYKC